jgi:hypothetical protein
MNYEEVLRLGEGAPGGRPPLVQFRNLHIYDGTIRISVPWSPSADIDSDAGRKELERERAKPGRMIENAPDGLRRIITVSKLTTRMPMVWASMPDRRPLTVDLDTLAGLLSDPAVPVRHIRGRIQVKGDSLIFAVESGALPNSQISGGGVLTWPEGPIWYDIGLDMPQLDLADIRWISPDFPDLAGPAVLAARTESPERTAFALRDMSLRGPAGGLDGVVTILQDKRRGLGVRDMRLRLEGLTLDAIRKIKWRWNSIGILPITVYPSSQRVRSRVKASFSLPAPTASYSTASPYTARTSRSRQCGYSFPPFACMEGSRRRAP